MKRQATVESSTYGSELVAARIATEMVIEMRNNLRALGVPVNEPSYMFGDNMSVVTNTTLPSSSLKKKHNAITYHRVREAIAAGILGFVHVKGDHNVADVLTKPVNTTTHKSLTHPLLFGKPSFTSQGEYQHEVPNGDLEQGNENDSPITLTTTETELARNHQVQWIPDSMWTVYHYNGNSMVTDEDAEVEYFTN